MYKINNVFYLHEKKELRYGFNDVLEEVLDLAEKEGLINGYRCASKCNRRSTVTAKVSNIADRIEKKDNGRND